MLHRYGNMKTKRSLAKVSCIDFMRLILCFRGLRPAILCAIRACSARVSGRSASFGVFGLIRDALREFVVYKPLACGASLLCCSVLR